MIETKEAFRRGKAYIPFITAGDPDLESTMRFVRVLEEAGADAIELGIPFSDPTAEGEVIEAAGMRALKGGATLEKIFFAVEKTKRRVPLLFMTYANPVYFYGYERFFERCRKAGVCGVIVPDIPFEESGEIKEIAVKYGVDVIDMVAPTSEERTETICRGSEGFIYLVSSLGVTGVRDGFSFDLKKAVNRIRKVTKTPVCVGFGISGPERAAEAAGLSDGAIVGSAMVKIIAEHGKEADGPLGDLARAIALAVHEK
ncbi:MAG: tryptophan synthase subunit alpha [Clostridia bacterium]|nr:tryptophan synthase subunit alpha [Clostridia bacterium]